MPPESHHIAARVQAWIGCFQVCALSLLTTPSAAQSTTKPDVAAKTPNFLGLDIEPLEGPLESDRPDFTECASTIPVGHVQLEGGYTFSYDDEKGVRQSEQTVPEFLLRLGTAHDFELRIGWTGWSLTEELFKEKNDVGRTIRREVHQDAATDMTLGFKARIARQKALIPDFSVIAELGVPTGGRAATAGDVEPQVKWLWAYDLTDRLSLAGNLNFAVPTSERGQFFQTSASTTLGYQFTDSLAAYVEYFGFYPNSLGTDAAHTLNGGFVFPVTDNFQLDVRAGVGMNEEAPDFFTGVGFVVRW